MFKKHLTSMLALLVFNFALSSTAFGWSTNGENAARDAEKVKTANKVWEKVIAAKGGRASLYSVENLVVSSQTQSPYDKKEFSNLHIIDFFVLPDKWWSWQDQRPGFTLGINQYDFGHEVVYKLTEGDSVFVVKPLKSPDTSEGKSLEAKIGEQYLSEKEKFLETELIYLLETKWFQPKIEGFRIVRNGFRNIEVVEVSFGREEIEYFLDPKTNLPYQMNMRTLLKTGRYYEDGFFLEDYVEVDGVKFPQVIRRGKKTDSKTTYLVNVKYNKSLFTSPPTIDMGPDAWKPRS